MPEILADGIVRIESLDGGALWKLVLNHPPHNYIDDAMVAALDAAFARAQQEKELRATILVAEGPDFSLGADAATLDPGRAAQSIPPYLNLIRRILDTPVFRAAVLHGRCMGRGLELARVCNRVYAEPEARVGLPEIELGLLPPVASILLPERIGRGAAAELCATGYVKNAKEASWMALVDHAVEDPEPFALHEIRHFLLPLSASSLRLSLKAVDLGFRARVLQGLEQVERLYLDELTQTHDAREGVAARREGRKPRWRHA